MHIVVCLKQTLDPEIPPKDFKIDPVTRRPAQGTANLVLDSYGENALEMAIQLREKTGGKISVVTAGDKKAEDVLRHALSLTADAAVRVWDDALAELDAAALAHALARTVTDLGAADLILTGRQAADLERGSIGPMIAEELGVPCITFVTTAVVAGDRVRLTRETEGGYEVVESTRPCVLTVTSHETNVLRLAKVKDKMMAMRKPIAVKGPADLDLDPDKLHPRAIMTDMFIPEQEGQCHIIGGDDGAARAAGLVRKLQDMKVW